MCARFVGQSTYCSIPRSGKDTVPSQGPLWSQLLLCGPATRASWTCAQCAPSWETAWDQVPPPAWFIACQTPLYRNTAFASFSPRGLRYLQRQAPGITTVATRQSSEHAVHVMVWCGWVGDGTQEEEREQGALATRVSQSKKDAFQDTDVDPFRSVIVVTLLTMWKIGHG